MHLTASEACRRAREREFAWDGSRTYLNAASFGAVPERAVAAVEAFNRRRQDPFLLPDHDFFTALVDARAALARLIGAEDAEIALAPNTSAGVNLAASLLARPAARGGIAEMLEGRRTILLSDREFPTNVYPWRWLERSGFRVELLDTDARGCPREDAMLERLRVGDVAALAISSVQFSSGYRADLAALGAACREQGTFFVVDAIQSLGALPLDVRAIGADVLACGGQKWLCSPFGTGFVYVRRELAARLEPAQPGWLALAASADFTRLLEYDDELLPDARRFEVGSIAVQDFIGLTHATELLLEIGVERIWEHLRTIQEPLLEWSRARGVELVSDARPEHRSGIVCVRPRDAAAAFRELAAAGVVCAVREGALRLSPHFYNTIEEMTALVTLLDRVARA